ncbi:nitrous oxide reductase accessory protein NosL [Geomesophilobacter sediminis]|uniref:Nitrous oxide reductase accessory protein NosL n=1 Tax=Geomesophilobacter sediminis TaxID=2798584 RepID=A0A8J7M3C8_9BACT|nr:nitrous oxide reductase accessory protein NosL [Geomesophilobacter sediminis]MBJ6727999.1 nitrous oxide reductase accessory protein NosL [Geomesophilobacter sediminis]
MNKYLVSLCSMLIAGGLLFTAAAGAGELKPRQPGPKDKCGVCGMFVAKYRNFAAQIQFRDGSVVFFDGPKDFFTYYRALSSFNPRKSQKDVSSLIVTDYYEVAPIDASRAWYVIGSDINGPMGQELVPFRDQRAAKEFARDHKGKRVLRFQEVTPALLREIH